MSFVVAYVTVTQACLHFVKITWVHSSVFELYFKFFKILCIYLFFFSCAGSSLLHAGFLQLQQTGFSLVAVHQLLTLVVSLAAECGV